MVLATVVAFVVFMAWPTTVERPPYDPASPVAPLWAGLYAFDAPTNAFPSLHVALAVIAAAAMVPEGGVWRAIGPLWAGAIVVSTLTTKQHVAVDLAGGFAVGGASLLAIRRVTFVALRADRPLRTRESALIRD
jgi:membrane-associated phospholipid phosphatase